MFVCLLCPLLTAGCSNDHSDTRANSNNENPSGDRASSTEGSTPRDSAEHSRFLDFPRDDAVGTWVTTAEIESQITFADVRFQAQTPLPDWGYVPVQAMGHTLSANLRNQTNRYLANIELIVTATDRKTKKQLAVLSTSSVVPYFLVSPNTTVQRTIELTFGENGEQESPFASADSWSDCEVSIEVRRARFIDNGEAE